MHLHQLEIAMLQHMAQARKAEMPEARLAIEETEAIATSPEGKTARMPLETLLTKTAAGQMNTGPVILPDGIKAVLSQGPITIWIWESPPRVYHFDWIANDSTQPFGQGTKYRKVRLALPYVIVLATFARNEAGLPQLVSGNECFFRNAPLKQFEDELCYPALLNCSKFNPPEGHPLSWICTQHLRATPKMQGRDAAERFCAGFEALRHCLLETAFNYSSDHHEARQLVQRIALGGSAPAHRRSLAGGFSQRPVVRPGNSLAENRADRSPGGGSHLFEPRRRQSPRVTSGLRPRPHHFQYHVKS